MSEDREALEIQVAALLELGERSRTFPLYYYESATPAAKSFHQSRAMLRILAGGNRSGKSQANAVEVAATALGYRPWVLREMGVPAPAEPWVRPDGLPPEALVFNGAGVRVQVPNTVLVVTGLPSARGIGEIMHPKLQELLGPLIEKVWMAHANVPAKIRLKNGSVIVYISDESDTMAFEGTAYDATFVDEPIKKKTYTALRRGLIDRFGRITLTMTPIGRNAAWMFHDLYREADKAKVEIFQCSIYDNRFLSREAIAEFVSDPTLSEMEQEARLYGRFMHLADRIYPQFTEAVHVIDPVKPDFDWYFGMAVDPATVKPWAIVYFAVSPRGDIIVYKEWPDKDITKIRRDGRSPQDYAQLIRQLDADTSIAVRIMDPNYGQRSDLMRGRFIPSVSSDLARYGLHFDTQVADDLEYGEGKVRQLLAYDDKRPVTSLNRPRLFICANCINTINSLKYYSFKTKTGSDDPDDSKRNENFKDFADAVRYMAVKLADVGAGDLGYFPDEAPTTNVGTYGEAD